MLGAPRQAHHADSTASVLGKRVMPRPATRRLSSARAAYGLPNARHFGFHPLGKLGVTLERLGQRPICRAFLN